MAWEIGVSGGVPREAEQTIRHMDLNDRTS